MFDTYGRKYVEPIIEKTADFYIRLNRTPNQITGLAFLLGISSGIAIVFDMKILAVVLLWISGFHDAVDGSMARKTEKISALGTLMDITFDRMVELAVIIALAYLYPSISFYMVILLSSIIISMTIFLTVGALSKNSGKKSFKYQAGLAERTEGFIMSSLMIIFPSYLKVIANIYIILIVITIIQRSLEARKILRNGEQI